jgi:hypothetical protein
MSHDSDASVGDSGIENNENVVVSKERLSVTYSHGCSSAQAVREGSYIPMIVIALVLM